MLDIHAQATERIAEIEATLCERCKRRAEEEFFNVYFRCPECKKYDFRGMTDDFCKNCGWNTIYGARRPK